MTAQPLSDTFADGLCYIYLQVLLGGKLFELLVITTIVRIN